MDYMTSYVKTMTGNETAAYVQGWISINHLDPGGADRTFNPTATFPAGYEMVIINTGEEIVIFDSTVLGQSGGAVAEGGTWIITNDGVCTKVSGTANTSATLGENSKLSVGQSTTTAYVYNKVADDCEIRLTYWYN